MVTEAQKRANARYKAKLKAEGAIGHVTVTFYGKDMALLEYARAHGPAATFVKQLIRERMEAERGRNERYNSIHRRRYEKGRCVDGRQG